MTQWLSGQLSICLWNKINRTICIYPHMSGCNGHCYWLYKYELWNFGFERYIIINVIHYKWLKGAYCLPLSFAAPSESLSFSKFKVERTLSKRDTPHFFRHCCQGLGAPIVIYSWNHGETGKRERSSTVSLLSGMLWNSTIGDFIKEGCLWTACLWRLTVEEREVPSFCCLMSVAWVVAQQGRETGV